MLVFLFIERWPSTVLVALLAVLGATRLAAVPKLGVRARVAAVTALLVFCGIAWAGTSPAIIKLYPVLICIAGIAYGVWTLRRPPSAIERFVMLTKPAELLDDRKRAYMRHVTQIWVAFFCFNGAVATYTAVAGSTAAWAIYNGLVSYLLMGLLFGGEYVVRCLFRRRHYPDTANAQ